MPARSSVFWRLLSVLLAFSLLAAACGGDDDEPESGSQSTNPDTETGGTVSPADTSTNEVTIAPTEEEAARGGTLRIGVEAEVDGINPSSSALSAPGLWMGRTVFDTLTVYLPDGGWAPHLAETVTPADDFTYWDVKVREGVTFHDGAPFNAEAVAANFEAQRSAGLVGIAVRPFYPDPTPDCVAADVPSGACGPATEVLDEFTIRFFPVEPDANWPKSMASQLGMMASPAWLEAALADPALDQRPVGTGPFALVDRDLDNVTRFERNEDWWGIGILQDDIWLDAVEFYTGETDGAKRVDQLNAEQLDVLHATGADSVIPLRDGAASGELQLVEDDTNEEFFVMINSDSPPFDDIRARQALTFLTNREAFNTIIAEDVNRTADGPFTPESPYFDPALVQEGLSDENKGRALELIAEYCGERGGDENTVLGTPACSDGKINMEFQYSGPSDIQTRIAELFRDNGWSDGFNVTFDEQLQDDHIQATALGQYNVNTWRQFGAPDPSRDAVWLMCRTASGISLNWPRYCDTERDANIIEGNSGVDDATFIALQQDVARSMNEAYTYVFLNHSLWAYAYSNDVRNPCEAVSAGGERLRCTQSGWQWLHQIWMAS